MGKRKKKCKAHLGFTDFIDDTGRCEVENSGTAINGSENRWVVEKINLEQKETLLCSFKSF